MDSLWNTENRRHILPSVMSMNNFQRISRIIRFDDRKTTLHCRKKDSLAAIRDMWDDCVACLAMMCNPGAYVTADKRLILFKGSGSFRHSMYKDAPFSTGRDCKPEMILDYNATKRAVGNLDKMLASYTCEHMTARWPLVQQRLPIKLEKAPLTPQIHRRKRLPGPLTATYFAPNVQIEEQGLCVELNSSEQTSVHCSMLHQNCLSILHFSFFNPDRPLADTLKCQALCAHANHFSPCRLSNFSTSLKSVMARTSDKVNKFCHSGQCLQAACSTKCWIFATRCVLRWADDGDHVWAISLPHQQMMECTPKTTMCWMERNTPATIKAPIISSVSDDTSLHRQDVHHAVEIHRLKMCTYSTTPLHLFDASQNAWITGRLTRPSAIGTSTRGRRIFSRTGNLIPACPLLHKAD
ncbi:hypothetical protein T4B_13313 [Trichinella pseudospiralis]|uniref:PiggyBac transposable element-derived protein domain-containing protein n=1 Tax=Trichinella pseudospiralis TaxID=6337 RepID=A0A0V1IMR4_TRIPS|nr:hypothetical protein T4B_13313 [Trichinella pseudospiralis]